MYFTDRGIEELQSRRGDEEVTFAWLAERLVEFVDLNPEFEIPVERLATWLARLDDDLRRLSEPCERTSYEVERSAAKPPSCRDHVRRRRYPRCDAVSRGFVT